MANLWWITVTLTFFLSAGCLAQVDQNKLAPLIYKIRALGIHEGRIYSVAVSIHTTKEENAEYKIKPKFLPKEDDINNINGGQVYSNNRLVAAIPHGGQHAEQRVLEELKEKLNKNQFYGGDLLVIFSSASPCDEHCVNQDKHYNILDKIDNIKKKNKWKNYAFVFENVFWPGEKVETNKIDESKLKEALKKIGDSVGGLANVFRCYDPKAIAGFKCIRCIHKKKVNKKCVDYDA